MKVWRVARAFRARTPASAFDGNGGLRAPGRWHSIGRRVVYTAKSESLAKLETLGHLLPGEMPNLVLVQGIIPDDAVGRVAPPYPAGWDSVPEGDGSRGIGDRWLEARTSLALEVPSIHSNSEMNVLINPAHADFGRITISTPVPFAFDARLIGR